MFLPYFTIQTSIYRGFPLPFLTSPPSSTKDWVHVVLCSSRCCEETRQKLEEERQDHNKTKDDDKVRRFDKMRDFANKNE